MVTDSITPLNQNYLLKSLNFSLIFSLTVRYLATSRNQDQDRWDDHECDESSNHHYELTGVAKDVSSLHTGALQILTNDGVLASESLYKLVYSESILNEEVENEVSVEHLKVDQIP